MTVFEQRRREAALQKDVPFPSDPKRLVGVRAERKQQTTYAKTGHTVPENGGAKLPLGPTE
jgi:hypothetical protein